MNMPVITTDYENSLVSSLRALILILRAILDLCDGLASFSWLV